MLPWKSSPARRCWARRRPGADGDFAIVLDDPLKPGGHELVLRSTAEDKVVATSPETAVVSIPEQKEGQVLALVEKPGEPSKLITVPEPEPVGPKPAPQAESKPASQDGKPTAKAKAPPATKEPAAPEQPAIAQNETPPPDRRKLLRRRHWNSPKQHPPSRPPPGKTRQPPSLRHLPRSRRTRPPNRKSRLMPWRSRAARCSSPVAPIPAVRCASMLMTSFLERRWRRPAGAS